MQRVTAAMERASRSSGPIQGQLLRLSTHREVAIYLREGSTWIADFVDGHGVLADVHTWLRFNCGTPANAYAARRAALESAFPLTAELVARIEPLHQDAVARRTRSQFVRSNLHIVPIRPLLCHWAASAFTTREQEACFGMFSIPLQD